MGAAAAAGSAVPGAGTPMQPRPLARVQNWGASQVSTPLPQKLPVAARLPGKSLGQGLAPQAVCPSSAALAACSPGRAAPLPPPCCPCAQPRCSCHWRRTLERSLVVSPLLLCPAAASNPSRCAQPLAPAASPLLLRLVVHAVLPLPHLLLHRLHRLQECGSSSSGSSSCSSGSNGSSSSSVDTGLSLSASWLGRQDGAAHPATHTARNAHLSHKSSSMLKVTH